MAPATAPAGTPFSYTLVITNNGWSRPGLRVVDLDLFQVVQKLDLDDAWLGLAWLYQIWG